MNIKKIILIILFILVTLGMGYMLYRTFFAPRYIPEIEENMQTGEETQTIGLPFAREEDGDRRVPISQKEPGEKDEEEIIPETEEPNLNEYEKQYDEHAQGRVTRTEELNQEPSISPVLNKNGRDLQYYNQDDGKFYRIDPNGNKELLSDKTFYNVENIEWAPQEEKAILEYPDGSNILYNFAQEKQVTLPKHWKDFNFAPSSDKLVMKSMGNDPDNRWLAVSNEDGSKVRAIEYLGDDESEVYPSWSPSNQIVGMYVKGVDFDRQEIYFVGLNKENFKSTIIEGRDFRHQWSPEGDRLLYSVYSSSNNTNPMLWIVNAQGDDIGKNRKKLEIETWADKCAWSDNEVLYCAVPESLPDAAGLFPELARDIPDRLYKINTKTGLKKLMAIPDQGYNMSNLVISEDQKNLYFTDQETQRIRRIKL